MALPRNRTQKGNVAAFNADVKNNRGYRYTTHAPYSSLAANQRMTRATASLLPAGTRTVIDIGCGDGTYTHDLRSLRPDIAFTGFDAAFEAVASARARFPGIDYRVGDLLDPATFPEARFDVAVVRGVIHHLPDAAAGIANAGRLADRVILIEPNGNNPILKWLERHSRYHIEHEEQSHGDAVLAEWCRAAGFTVFSSDYIGFIPFFFPTWPAKVIHLFQPLLERIGPLKKYFGAQIVMVYGKDGA